MAKQEQLYTIGRDAVMQLTSVLPELYKYKRIETVDKVFGEEAEDFVYRIEMPPNHAYVLNCVKGYYLFDSWQDYNNPDQEYSYIQFRANGVDDGMNITNLSWHVSPIPYYYQAYVPSFTKFNPAIPEEFDYMNPNFDWSAFEEWKREHPDIPEYIPRDDIDFIDIYFHSPAGSKDELHITMDFVNSNNRSVYWINKPDEVDVDFQKVLDNIQPKVIQPAWTGQNILPIRLSLTANNGNGIKIDPEFLQTELAQTPTSTIMRFGTYCGFTGDKVQIDCNNLRLINFVGAAFLNTFNASPGSSKAYDDVFINMDYPDNFSDHVRVSTCGINHPYILQPGSRGAWVFNELITKQIDAYLASESTSPFYFNPSPIIIDDYGNVKIDTYPGGYDDGALIMPRDCKFDERLVRLPNINIGSGYASNIVRMICNPLSGGEGYWKVNNIPVFNIGKLRTEKFSIFMEFEPMNDYKISPKEVTFAVGEGAKLDSDIIIVFRAWTPYFMSPNAKFPYVYDDETYNLYKDQPYICGGDYNDAEIIARGSDYYAFNRESAVKLFNSLPPMAEGYKGTINFVRYDDNSNPGCKTGENMGWDDIADEEIAVATERGWTVTFSKNR